jgi:hypothetical protein
MKWSRAKRQLWPYPIYLSGDYSIVRGRHETRQRYVYNLFVASQLHSQHVRLTDAKQMADRHQLAERYYRALQACGYPEELCRQNRQHVLTDGRPGHQLTEFIEQAEWRARRKRRN